MSLSVFQGEESHAEARRPQVQVLLLWQDDEEPEGPHVSWAISHRRKTIQVRTIKIYWLNGLSHEIAHFGGLHSPSNFKIGVIIFPLIFRETILLFQVSDLLQRLPIQQRALATQEGRAWYPRAQHETSREEDQKEKSGHSFSAVEHAFDVIDHYYNLWLLFRYNGCN